MRAILIHPHGGPQAPVHEGIPEPKIRPGRVLVRMGACALHHPDLFVRGGILVLSAGGR